MIGLGGVLAFFGSALGRYAIIALIASVGVGGIWKAGYNYANRACQAAALRAELAAKQKDLDVAKAAAEKAEQDRAALAQQVTVNNEEIARYVAGSKAAACPAADADVQLDRRLLGRSR